MVNNIPITVEKISCSINIKPVVTDKGKTYRCSCSCGWGAYYRYELSWAISLAHKHIEIMGEDEVLIEVVYLQRITPKVENFKTIDEADKFIDSIRNEHRVIGRFLNGEPHPWKTADSRYVIGDREDLYKYYRKAKDV